MLGFIVRSDVRSIEQGYQDDKIIDEYTQKKEEKKGTFGPFQTVLLVFVVLALSVFGLTFFVKFQNPRVEGNMPVPRVVLSGSMAYKNESNKYLQANGLDDQFETFDLIFTHELPGEFELELYDVVVYELRGELIVHRIIGIEEPNENHPDHRLFQLRGDAVHSFSHVDDLHLQKLFDCEVSVHYRVVYNAAVKLTVTAKEGVIR